MLWSRPGCCWRGRWSPPPRWASPRATRSRRPRPGARPGRGRGDRQGVPARPSRGHRGGGAGPARAARARATPACPGRDRAAHRGVAGPPDVPGARAGPVAGISLPAGVRPGRGARRRCKLLPPATTVERTSDPLRESVGGLLVQRIPSGAVEPRHPLGACGIRSPSCQNPVRRCRAPTPARRLRYPISILSACRCHEGRP